MLYATDGRDILQNTPDGWEVDRPWLWWDGPAGTDGTGGPWGNPPPSADGDLVSTRSGGVLPAIARCRSLICDVLAGVPWQVFRGREQQRTPDWLLDPQGLRQDARVGGSVAGLSHSAVEFWSAYILSAVELGEGIAYVPRGPNDYDAEGRPLPPKPPLYLLNPKRVRLEAGYYWVDDERLEPEDLIITRARVWPGKTRGIGVWDQFRTEIGFGTSLRDYASNMLGRGIPAGYLKVTAPDLEQDEADRLKQRWMAAHGGTERRIAVLNATTEFTPLQIDPQALQLTELLRLSAWEIALIYGIPPYKLGISMGYSNTYANIESASIEYVQEALLTWARRIESAFDAVFPRGTSLKLNLDGLQRADTTSRFTAYEIALGNGFMTVDEVRQLEDLPPMPATAVPAPAPTTTPPTITINSTVDPRAVQRQLVHLQRRGTS